MTSARPEPTAAETYDARRSDIARLLDVLDQTLTTHRAQMAQDPKNWGHAGDLGKVRSDLIDMVGFLSGMEREDIEAFLAE